MDIGWLSAIMEGPGIEPLDEDAVILLPTLPEEVAKYERRYPQAKIQDLADNGGQFQNVFQRRHCGIFDLLPQDCSLRELNAFLNAAHLMTENQFEDGVCRLLEVKQRRPGGKLHTADMLRQTTLWEAKARRCGQTEQVEQQDERRIPMNFFAGELRKIVGPTHPDATYSGRACYLKLGDTNRAKLEFVTQGTADHYEALRITVLNRLDGPVDKHTMLFRELIDVKGARDECFRRDIPYAWTYNGQTEWYAYQPTAADYKTMGAAVDEYLGIF